MQTHCYLYLLLCDIFMWISYIKMYHPKFVHTLEYHLEHTDFYITTFWFCISGEFVLSLYYRALMSTYCLMPKMQNRLMCTQCLCAFTKWPPTFSSLVIILESYELTRPEDMSFIIRMHVPCWNCAIFYICLSVSWCSDVSSSTRALHFTHTM